MEWTSPEVIMPLCGVVVGGAIAFGATIYSEQRRDRRTTKHLALAFRGEVQALRTIVKRRKYIEYLKALIEHMRTTNQKIKFSVRVHREYFNVYKSNVDKIGMLASPLPELIAEFYVMGNSILEDLELFDTGGLDEQTANAQIERYSELLELFEETMRKAEAIVREIDNQYGSAN